MKANVSVELKKRLEYASKNGSVIASDILNELKKDKKECFGDKTLDYFDSVRVVGTQSEYKSLCIKISVCTKDVTSKHFPDRGNPRAPWFAENREKIALGTFVGLFKGLDLDKYSTDDTEVFYSAMCVNDVIKYRVSNKMEDFERAYNGTNYYPFGMNSPLHNSCMRYEATARNAADFYTNFAGARILIAEDSQNQILGRAIVWDNVIIPNVFVEPVKVLDRLYFCFEFVRIGLMNYAHDVLGINIRKNQNSVGTQRDFYFYPESGKCGAQRYDAYIVVPKIKWHKKGSPYMDTFSSLSRYEGSLVLTNSTYFGTRIVDLAVTGGFGNIANSICPMCGCRSYGNTFCDDCKAELFENTPFGNIIKGATKTYKGKKYPSALFANGKPTEHFATWIGVQRICDSTFKL